MPSRALLDVVEAVDALGHHWGLLNPNSPQRPRRDFIAPGINLAPGHPDLCLQAYGIAASTRLVLTFLPPLQMGHLTAVRQT